MKSKIQLVSFVTIVDVHERLPGFEHQKWPKNEHFSGRCERSFEKQNLSKIKIFLY